MKARVLVFYAISILSLTLFVISPSADSSSLDDVIPKFEVSHMLIGPAEQLIGARRLKL